MATRKKKQSSTTETSTDTPTPRDYVQAPVVDEPGITCCHCRTTAHDHKVTHTYPNGNRRRRCSHCYKPFVSRRAAEAQ